MRSILLLLLAGAAPALAEGFASRDLTTATVDTAAFEGGSFEAEATSPGRLTIFCTDCEGFTAIDVLMGGGDAGLERRLREDEGTVGELEARCRERAPSCRIVPVTLGAAIGYRSTYEAASTRGSTAVVMLDGEGMTVRSIAPDTETASANAEAALDTVGRAMILGR